MMSENRKKIKNKHFRFTEKEEHLLIGLAEELGISNTEMIMKALWAYRRALDKKKARQQQQ